MPNFVYELIDINPNKLKTDGNLQAAMKGYGLDYLGIQSPREIVVTEYQQRVFVHRQNAESSATDPVNPNLVWTTSKRFPQTRWGIDPASVPDPADLARPRLCPGIAIPDSAGRTWTIPIALSPREGNATIPSNYLIDLDTGTIFSSPKPEFQWLCDLSSRLSAHWFGGDSLENDQLVDAAIRILQVNYAIGPAEINLLAQCGFPAIDSQNAQLITLFVLDNPMLNEAAQKEKENESACGFGVGVVSVTDCI